MLAKKHKLKFQTEKSRKASQTKRFFLGFLLIVVVFGSISALYFLKSINFDVSTFFGNANDDTTTQDEQETTPFKLYETKYFLVYCTDSTADDLYFTAIVKADLNKHSFTVCTLSQNERVTVAQTNASLIEHYKSAGAIRLVQAIEELAGIEIDRYIGSTESNFKKAINEMGSLAVTIDKRIDFKNEDFMLSLIEGEQGLKGDTLLKYLRYFSLSGDNGLDGQANIFCLMLEQYISPKNVKNGESLFGKLINYVDSNISILDYTNSTEYLEIISDGPINLSCFAVGHLNELNSND
ncbi:MAG TPA: LCP family protein [Clostridia bacterium]|nr:LCP family protein [Clostridia bacterium]